MTRTTVTLDADAERLLRQRMRKRGVSFKQALNDSIRDGNTSARGPSSATRARSMGVPRMDLTKALELAGQLEDAELITKLQRGR